MKIQFLGATRMVTGSCFLVESGGRKILIDCGMFQGVGVEEKNWEDLVFNPENLDAVILTHAHLDHCGLLPKLYKYGFRGKVYSTIPTRAIIEHILLDSAKVQELRYQEGIRGSKRSKRDFKRNDWKLVSQRDEVGGSYPKPIYDTVDVLGLLENTEAVDFKKLIHLNNIFSFSFLRVGHAIGAASVKLVVREKGKKKVLLFSGDIGNATQELDSRFDYCNEADYVIMESLYGGKLHDDRIESERRFKEVINRTVGKRGNVIIPSFTLQRTQETLYILRKLIENNQISKNIKIYIDSPLAIKITEIYKQHYENLNPEVIKKIRSGENLFSMKNFIFIKDAKMSRRIRKRRGSIILAGSGMCVGGRIVYHLLHNLSDKRSSIVFVGFQAEGTLGRKILGGKDEVIVENKLVRVKADIVRLAGFSAHADHNQLMKWLRAVDKSRLEKVFLIHAEEKVVFKLKEILMREGYDVIIPKWKQVFSLE